MKLSQLYVWREKFRQKRWVKPCIFGLLTLLLWLAPVGMGGNRWVPIVGWGEAAVDNYCLQALGKTMNVYQVVCAMDSALSVARGAQISAGAFGVSGSAALAPVHDTVKTLSDFLTGGILLLLTERQIMGMLSWLCLKLALCSGLLCLACASFYSLRRLKSVGLFLCKAGLGVWLILPLTAVTATFVDNHYITPKYNTQAERVKTEIAKVFNLAQPGRDESLADMAAKAAIGFGAEGGQGLGAKIRELYNYLRGSAANPNDLATLIMLMFSQIAVIVFAAPVIMVLILGGVCKIFLGDKAYLKCKNADACNARD